MREAEEGGGGARRVREGARGCVAMLEGPWRHGGSRRWPGKQEVAEAASVPVGHARCLLAQGRRQGGTPGGLGRTGGLPAQELGRLLAPGGALGGLQVGGPGRLLLFFLFLFCFLLFNILPLF